MAPFIVDQTRIREFTDKDAFYTWLSKHHASEPELWIKIHNKASGLPTITAKEAIDVVLCWGWIDGIGKSFDENSYIQRYTPRGRKSIWSKINVDNVQRLIAEGRMTEHGLVHVEAAKADGRWDRAYGSGRNLALAPEFIAAVEADPKAKAMLAALTEQNRFALAFRLHNTKTPAGRAKKIADFVAMLARGETIYPQADRSKPTQRKGPARKPDDSGGAAGGRGTRARGNG